MMNASRKGYSLVELIVVMAALSVLLSLVTATLALLLRGTHRGGELISQQATLDRLAAQLRQDVHAAEDAAIVDGERLTVAFDSKRRAEYRAELHGVQRTEYAGDKPVGHELYRLPTARHVEARKEQTDAWVLAGFDIAFTNSNAEEVTAWNLPIRAVVGRDRDEAYGQGGEANR
ncbi:MAG: prepilin-type N-terminal cleavage/methylation domain-containing protein [Planctomycetales bacterium]|nr:prepilin-type N-terminal cleavage/methylation domain-containing protein [Planctomycetales bacterium]